MPAQTRTVTQTSEIVQDTMPADSSYDTDGEILNDALSPFTLRKLFRWIVGLSKTVIGEAGRRRGVTRIQGEPVKLTGLITTSGTAVTGSSSLFLSELEAGSWIAGPAGEYREILSISADTSATLVQAFSVDIGSASAYTRLTTLAERVAVIERFQNHVLNGDFDYWQRGTSFTTPSSLAFTADRFQVEYDGSIGAFDILRQSFALGQTDVPDEPKYFFRWDQTGAGSGQTVKRINHKIESVRSLAGKTIQVKFYAKVGASTQTITVGAIQNFGTGGSPSSEVTVTAKSRTLTTSWQAFNVELAIPSISGKTIGNDNNDYLNIVINLPLNVTFIADVSHMQVYEGTSNRAWVRAHSESDNILRYFFGAVVDVTTVVAHGGTNNAGNPNCILDFPLPMRATPTLYPIGGAFVANDFFVNDLNGSQNVSGFSYTGASNKNRAYLDVTPAAALTVNSIAFLYQNNSSRFMGFDAELP